MLLGPRQSLVRLKRTPSQLTQSVETNAQPAEAEAKSVEGRAEAAEAEAEGDEAEAGAFFEAAAAFRWRGFFPAALRLEGAHRRVRVAEGAEHGVVDHEARPWRARGRGRRSGGTGGGKRSGWLPEIEFEAERTPHAFGVGGVACACRLRAHASCARMSRAPVRSQLAIQNR
jgi:hypothetical protein